MEGVEGVGEAVTGGIAARAVEPQHGAAGHAAGHEDGHGRTCLNCRTELVGEYCHGCGQQAHVHRTLSAFWHDIAHGVLHFEGKIWRTLPLLAWRPGDLTRRYLHGERAKFVSPMALFLFSVFMMFAVISAFGGPFDLTSATPVADRAEAEREYREQRAETEARLRQLEADLAGAKAAGQPTAKIEDELNGARLARKLEDDAYKLAVRLSTGEEARGEAETMGSSAARPQEQAGEQRVDMIGKTGWPALDAAMEKAAKNPSLLIYKLQTNAYKFSWALIPISVPFLWLLFLHRRRYRQYKAYDHIVFVTYSISFMSLGFILLTLLKPLGIGEALTASAILFIPPIHMYRQLKGAYQLSRWSALWRTFLLIIFAPLAGGLFFTFLLGLGALG